MLAMGLFPKFPELNGAKGPPMYYIGPTGAKLQQKCFLSSSNVQIAKSM